MARMKKATAKKAAPKKVGKRPAPKRQAPKEELTPVPTQQNPQPPMGTPPMGANGPMMRKGGKIKKMQGGGPAKDKYKNLGGEIGNPPFDKNSPVTYLPGRPAKNVPTTKKVIKKSQGGTKFGMLSVKAGVDNNPNPTAADRIVGAKKNAGKAKSGAALKKQAAVAIAMKKAGKTPSGKKVEKAQFGKLLGGVGKKLLGGAMGKIGNMAGGKIGNMLSGGSGFMKSGGSMKKKCKYGCK